MCLPKEPDEWKHSPLLFEHFRLHKNNIMWMHVAFTVNTFFQSAAESEVQQQRVLFVRSVDTSFTIQREEKSPNSRERLKHINVHVACCLHNPSLSPPWRCVPSSLLVFLFSSVLAFPLLLAFSIWLVYYDIWPLLFSNALIIKLNKLSC